MKWPSTKFLPIGAVPDSVRGSNHSYRRGVLNGMNGFASPALAGGVIYGGYEYGRHEGKKAKVKLKPKANVKKSFPFSPDDARPASSMDDKARAKLREHLIRNRSKPVDTRPLEERGRKSNPSPKTVKAAQGRFHDAREHRFTEGKVQAAAREAAATKVKIEPPKKRPFIRHAQVSSAATKGGLLTVGPYYLKRRNDKRERGEKPIGGKAVDAAVGAGVGATVGDEGMLLGGWSSKRMLQRHRENTEAHWKAEGGKDDPRLKQSQAAWKAHKKKIGFTQMGENHPGDRVDATKPSVQRRISGTYPKEMPGWRGQRALAFKNKPAVGFLVPVAAGAVGMKIAASRAKVAERRGR
jgi:hypothetical protein